MDKYAQLSKENRHQISALLDEGLNQTQIAANIGVHRSTISRELNRNVTGSGPEGKSYCPKLVQQLTEKRHREKSKHRRFAEDLKKQARRWLTEEKLRPELISGRWQVKGTRGVSHETLYQWIWEAKLTGDPDDKNLYKDLRHDGGNRQDSRGRIKD